MITGNNIVAMVTLGVLCEVADEPTADLSNGITAGIEAAMAARLASLELDGSKVFKTAQQWKFQISADVGGAEAFARYAPFAFVHFMPQTDGRREAGELNQVLKFAVGIGAESKERGIARIGDENRLGISKLRDMVIDLFDGWHPGEGFECNDLYFDTDEIQIDSPTRHGLVLYFITNIF